MIQEKLVRTYNFQRISKQFQEMWKNAVFVIIGLKIQNLNEKNSGLDISYNEDVLKVGVCKINKSSSSYIHTSINTLEKILSSLFTAPQITTSHSLSPSLSISLFLSLSLFISLSFSLSFPLTHSFYLSFSLSLSLFLTHTLSLSLCVFSVVVSVCLFIFFLSDCAIPCLNEHLLFLSRPFPIPVSSNKKILFMWTLIIILSWIHQTLSKRYYQKLELNHLWWPMFLRSY